MYLLVQHAYILAWHSMQILFVWFGFNNVHNIHAYISTESIINGSTRIYSKLEARSLYESFPV